MHSMTTFKKPEESKEANSKLDKIIEKLRALAKLPIPQIKTERNGHLYLWNSHYYGDEPEEKILEIAKNFNKLEAAIDSIATKIETKKFSDPKEIQDFKDTIHQAQTLPINKDNTEFDLWIQKKVKLGVQFEELGTEAIVLFKEYQQLLKKTQETQKESTPEILKTDDGQEIRWWN